ncbi:MAG TPA: trypsin-like peptidase domain-containing protein [Ktedonosporobacter sp.]|nr:trypsin-like peptidase domain-containing protein [Ktedonosporobacter sp.]
MTQIETSSTHSSFPLPDVFSSALVSMFNMLQPGIVQVRNGHRGGGTGVIWHQDGRIITNNHVVHGDRPHIQVHLWDGRTLQAELLHRNPELDLAVLKIAGDNLTPLPVGDSSKLRIGEWVFAIGHPWGQRWALTSGIVSSFSSLQITNDVKTRYIKSDVGLAPGNSGGPLLNADGEVIGINAMIFGGDLSVSIPSNIVSDWLSSLPKGRITLGIEIQAVELPAEVRQQVEPTRESGLLVVGTSGRQQHQDLLVGDILLDVAGKPVRDGATLRQILAEGEAGRNVSMRIVRAGSVLSVDIATQIAQDTP